MKIAIVGGGPSGLFFARLMKRAEPGHDITVFEQNPADATFGFGVGLGAKSLDLIRRYDPVVHEKMTAQMVFNNRQMIHLNGEEILLEYAAAGGAIARLGLLQVLQAACADAGIQVRHGDRLDDAGALSGHDLVVGADGINSLVRQHHADAFGANVSYLTNKFAWFGVADEMVPSGLTFRRLGDEVHVGHFYRYAPGMSTFVAECDAHTWECSGLAAMDDDARRARIEAIFAPELAGRPLVENRSIWRNFPVTTTQAWTAGNVVLLGDALRSAHFSIGSGTRLAMEDSIALFDAFREAGDDVPAALSRFVAIRKPIRDRFGSAAERSFLWYEQVRQAMEQPIIDFVHDFLTRTGRVDDQRLESYCPGFFELYRDRRGTAAAAV